MTTRDEVSDLDRTTPGVRLLSTREVAEILSVTTRTVQRMAGDGRLSAIRISTRATRYDPLDVSRLIRQATEAAPEA